MKREVCESFNCGAKATSVLSIGGVTINLCLRHFEKTFCEFIDPTDIFIFKRMKEKSKRWGLKKESNQEIERSFKYVPVKAIIPEWINLKFKTLDYIFSKSRFVVGTAWRAVKRKGYPIVYNGEVVEYGPVCKRGRGRIQGD